MGGWVMERQWLDTLHHIHSAGVEKIARMCSLFIDVNELMGLWKK